MSKLRYCDYTGNLVGKTITRVRWSNDPDYHSLTIDFNDQTQVSFRFNLTIEEDVELSDFIDGNLSNERSLTPIPIRAQIKPLEGE